jgi:hypothetical protein
MPRLGLSLQREPGSRLRRVVGALVRPARRRPGDLHRPDYGGERFGAALPRADAGHPPGGVSRRLARPESNGPQWLQTVLRPYPAAAMQAAPVNTWVNDARHEVQVSPSRSPVRPCPPNKSDCPRLSKEAIAPRCRAGGASGVLIRVHCRSCNSQVSDCSLPWACQMMPRTTQPLSHFGRKRAQAGSAAPARHSPMRWFPSRASVQVFRSSPASGSRLRPPAVRRQVTALGAGRRRRLTSPASPRRHTSSAPAAGKGPPASP